MANEWVTYVDPDGNETTLLTMSEDVPYESVQPLHETVKAQPVREFTFMEELLAESGVTLDVNGHFVIDGFRWDFLLGATINDHLFAPGGIHNIIIFRLRQSVPVEPETSDPEWENVP